MRIQLPPSHKMQIIAIAEASNISPTQVVLTLIELLNNPSIRTQLQGILNDKITSGKISPK